MGLSSIRVVHLSRKRGPSLCQGLCLEHGFRRGKSNCQSMDKELMQIRPAPWLPCI